MMFNKKCHVCDEGSIEISMGQPEATEAVYLVEIGILHCFMPTNGMSLVTT
jgi:hypothetical protein